MEGFWTVLANIEGPVLLWFQEVARRPGVNEAVAAYRHHPGRVPHQARAQAKEALVWPEGKEWGSPSYTTRIFRKS